MFNTVNISDINFFDSANIYALFGIIVGFRWYLQAIIELKNKKCKDDSFIFGDNLAIVSLYTLLLIGYIFELIRNFY